MSQEQTQEQTKEIPLPALILHIWREQARLYERHVGMSQSRQTLLLELRLAGEMSQADLVQRLGMEGTLVTRFVKQMEASGLVTRRSDPRDNRFTLVTLTPTGQDIAQQMADFTHTLEAQLLAGLSQEMQAAIRQGLTQIKQRYEQLRAADPTSDA